MSSKGALACGMPHEEDLKRQQCSREDLNQAPEIVFETAEPEDQGTWVLGMVEQKVKFFENQSKEARKSHERTEPSAREQNTRPEHEQVSPLPVEVPSSLFASV